LLDAVGWDRLEAGDLERDAELRAAALRRLLEAGFLDRL
jgi:hypothetical protein